MKNHIKLRAIQIARIVKKIRLRRTYRRASSRTSPVGVSVIDSLLSRGTPRRGGAPAGSTRRSTERRRRRSRCTAGVCSQLGVRSQLPLLSRNAHRYDRLRPRNSPAIGLYLAREARPLWLRSGGLAVRVVVVPPAVGRRLGIALGGVLPLLLAPESGHVEVAPGASQRLVA